MVLTNVTICTPKPSLSKTRVTCGSETSAFLFNSYFRHTSSEHLERVYARSRRGTVGRFRCGTLRDCPWVYSRPYTSLAKGTIKPYWAHVPKVHIRSGAPAQNLCISRWSPEGSCWRVLVPAQKHLGTFRPSAPKCSLVVKCSTRKRSKSSPTSRSSTTPVAAVGMTATSLYRLDGRGEPCQAQRPALLRPL